MHPRDNCAERVELEETLLCQAEVLGDTLEHGQQLPLCVLHARHIS